MNYIVRNFGILSSISESWYLLGEYNKEYLFTLFSWSMGGLMLFYIKDDAPYFFISATGFMFLGTASDFRSSAVHTNIIHYIGASLAIGGALFGIYFQYFLLFPLIFFLFSIILLSLLPIKNKLWWIEMSAFIFIVVGLLIK